MDDVIVWLFKEKDYIINSAQRNIPCEILIKPMRGLQLYLIKTF